MGQRVHSWLRRQQLFDKYWLKILGLSWIIAGIGFLAGSPRNDLWLVSFWAIMFIIGGLSATLLALRPKRFLWEITAGLCAAPPFFRALYVIFFGGNIVFVNRVISTTLWLFIGVTLTLGWPYLVPAPAVERLINEEGK